MRFDRQLAQAAHQAAARLKEYARLTTAGIMLELLLPTMSFASITGAKPALLTRMAMERRQTFRSICFK